MAARSPLGSMETLPVEVTDWLIFGTKE